jgi:hypothetical protein
LNVPFYSRFLVASASLRVACDGLLADEESGVVEDTHGQGSGVQVDAPVKSVLLSIEAHVMVSLGWVGPEPASWLG